MTTPLVIKQTGTIYKKCDTAAHKPDTNTRCAAGRCQHTCTDTGQCPHAWTLRYYSEGKQREASYQDEIRNGKVVYGSGLKKAQDAQLQMSTDKRAGDRVFADFKTSGKEKFTDTAKEWIKSRSVSEDSKTSYLGNLNKHIAPVFGDSTLSQVAVSRDRAQAILNGMVEAEASITPRRITRMILEGTLDEAVKAKKIREHLLSDLSVGKDEGTKKDKSDFVFPAKSQVQKVAGMCGIVIWLMRGLGLRIEEACGVRREDFIMVGKSPVLRLKWQATRNGKKLVPLKKRKRGDYRDIPVPGWLWKMVKDLPAGPLCPGKNGTYLTYGIAYRAFTDARDKAGIPEEFTFHSLRHAYASALLAANVSITDLAEWMGHEDIDTTYRTYGHLLKSSASRAVAALDAEYEQWGKTA